MINRYGSEIIANCMPWLKRSENSLKKWMTINEARQPCYKNVSFIPGYGGFLI